MVRPIEPRILKEALQVADWSGHGLEDAGDLAQGFPALAQRAG